MLMSAYKEDADNLNLIDVASRTFTPETLTGCQNLDTFQKSTYVERNPALRTPAWYGQLVIMDSLLCP